MTNTGGTPGRRRVRWQPGLLFAVPLADDSWGLGQTSDLMMKNVGYVALFSHRLPSLNADRPSVRRSDAVALTAVDRHGVASGRWPVLESGVVLFPKNEFANERFAAQGYIGAILFDHGIAEDLLSAYHGLIPWNGPYLQEDYLDRLLLPNLKRPAAAKIISPEERRKFRQDRGLPL